jgi:hypothetical protein
VYQAMDSFVAALKSGAELRVMKGEVLPDKHELVLRDLAGSGTLFRKLNLDDEDAPPAAGPKPKASLNLGRKSPA